MRDGRGTAERNGDDADFGRHRLVMIIVTAVVAMVVVGAGLLVVMRNARPDTSTPTPRSISGHTFDVTGGLNQNLPSRIDLGDDGTFVVVDADQPVDSGTYHTDGDHIFFVSEWIEGRGPKGFGVQWASHDCPGCHLVNVVMVTDKCEGVVGEYRLVIDGPRSLAFEVVWDECLQRTLVANGLQLEVRP